MFLHDPAHSGSSTITAPNTNNTKWNYTTGGSVGSSPAVVDGKVYVGSDDHWVYCLNSTTGAYIWSYITNYALESSVAVAEGKVYVSSGDGKVYCFGLPAFACLVVRGQDNRIYYRSFDSQGNSLSGWVTLPSGSTGDTPAAVVVGNQLHFIVRGMSGGSLWYSYLDLSTQTFSGWTAIGGSSPTAPTLTSNSTHLALVVRGDNNLICYRFYTIALQTWTDWTALPSGTTSDSPATSLLGNTLHIVVRGSDGTSLWYSNINPTTQTFSGWTLLSGSSPSTPTLTSNGTTLALVVRGQNNQIYYRTDNLATQTWTGWTALPSGTTTDSPAATIIGNTLYIVVKGSDGTTLWASDINLGTSSFSGWTFLSGSTPSKPTLTS